ncbi:MAG: TIM barrel protein, partial [Planctomycetota bacterium]
PGTLKRLGAYAAEFDVSLAVEPMRDRRSCHSVVKSVSDTIRLLDRVGLKNVGMAFPSLLMAHDRSLVNRVQEFAHAVKLVKLSDCRVSGARGQRRSAGQFPGFGSLPLATLVKRLGECGFTGDYELDVRNRAEWKRGDHLASLRRAVEWFRDLHEPTAN